MIPVIAHSYPFSEYHDLFQPIATIVGPAFATFFVGYYFSLKYNMSKTRLEITKECVKEFREILGADRMINKDNFFSLLSLIAEELVYMKKGYIIEGFANEWLNFMIDYMPIFNYQVNKDGIDITPMNFEIVNEIMSEGLDKPIKYQLYIIQEYQYLIYFRRIFEIFTLNKSFFNDLERFKINQEDFLKMVYPTEFTYIKIKEKELVRGLLIKHLLRNIKKCKD